MKLTKKLLPALGMLALSACMLVTSTFAWFAMNENVKAIGMSVTAKGDQVYLQIMSGSGADIFNGKDGAALPEATATDKASSTILPSNVVSTINDPATSCEDYNGDEDIIWVTNVGKSNTEGEAISTYTNVTTDATNANGTYYIKNTFSIRLDPTAGAEAAGAPLTISAISLSAAPDAADEFVGCLSVLVVSTIDSQVMGQVWAWDGSKFAKTLGATALSDGNFTAANPATVDVYVFFNGDDEDCTQAALATAQNTAYNVSVSFTVRAAA